MVKDHLVSLLRFNLSAFTESRDDFGLPLHMQNSIILRCEIYFYEDIIKSVVVVKITGSRDGMRTNILLL